MNQPEIYRYSNHMQRKDAGDVLDEFKDQLQWTVEDVRVLDVGCGDGSVTSEVLRPRISPCARVTGVDLSPEMIKYANAHFRDERTAFQVLDISQPVPIEEHGRYDHIFSSYCLNWVQKQSIAWTNIYDMLTPGGNCLHVFLAYNAVYDARKFLSKKDRWAEYMYDVDDCISPYQYSKDPKRQLEDVMTKCGFSQVQVECRHFLHNYDSIKYFRNAMSAVSPEIPRIPDHLQNEFFDNFIDALRFNGHVESDTNKNEDINTNVKTSYALLIARATKLYLNDMQTFYRL